MSKSDDDDLIWETVQVGRPAGTHRSADGESPLLRDDETEELITHVKIRKVVDEEAEDYYENYSLVDSPEDSRHAEENDEGLDPELVMAAFLALVGSVHWLATETDLVPRLKEIVASKQAKRAERIAIAEASKQAKKAKKLERLENKPRFAKIKRSKRIKKPKSISQELHTDSQLTVSENKPDLVRLAEDISFAISDYETSPNSKSAQRAVVAQLLAAALVVKRIRALHQTEITRHLPREFYDALGQLSSPRLTDMINQSLRTEPSPLEPAEAKALVHLFGGGSSENGNYTPIQNTLVIGRLTISHHEEPEIELM